MVRGNQLSFYTFLLCCERERLVCLSWKLPGNIFSIRCFLVGISAVNEAARYGISQIMPVNGDE